MMSSKQLHFCPLESKSREKEAGTLKHQISGEVILVVTFQVFSVEMLLKTAPTNTATFHRLVNPPALIIESIPYYYFL